MIEKLILGTWVVEFIDLDQKQWLKNVMAPIVSVEQGLANKMQIEVHIQHKAPGNNSIMSKKA